MAVAERLVDAADGGQYLSRVQPAGNAPCSRLYGRAHSPAITRDVCGAFRNGLSVIGISPAPIASISARMEIMVSQNLSNSVRSSDSVGSTINVPATGKLMVGAWNP